MRPIAAALMILTACGFYCEGMSQDRDTTRSFVRDTTTIRGSVSLSGLIQTGDENRSVLSLLSVITAGTHRYEVEPLTSIAYSTKPGAQVEGEYLENIIIRYHQQQTFYPAIGLSFESSFLRKIDYRFSEGITLVLNILHEMGQSVKLGVGYNHEYTQYKIGAFKPSPDTGQLHYHTEADQLYIRLKGRNEFFRNRLILTYDFFIQPNMKDFRDHRWTLIGNLDMPLTKKFSLRSSAVSSYESFVATNVHHNNFRLTYGINFSF